MQDISLRHDTATARQIADHFQSCEPEFYKSLAAKVDIESYIEKLLSKSRRCEAWIDGKLAGLLAIYSNDAGFDFITNLSVVADRQNLGVASRLLETAIESSSREIRLEVSKNNLKAQKIYEKFGFVHQSEDGASCYLVLRKDGS